MDSVHWESWGVRVDDVLSALADGQAIRAFLNRFSAAFLTYAFGGGEASPMRLISKAESVDAIRRRIDAGERAAVERLHIVALCHALLSGKRVEALELAHEALAGGGSGDSLPVREQLLLRCLQVIPHSAERLWLIALFDRAVRVQYKVYAPRGRDAQLTDLQAKRRLAERLAELKRESAHLRFEPVAPADGGVVGALPVVGAGSETFLFVYALDGRWTVERLSERLSKGTANQHPGSLMTPDAAALNWCILRFDEEGRVWSYGGELGLRVAEALISGDGVSFDFVPYDPTTPTAAFLRWFRKLSAGDVEQATLERALVSLPTFSAEIAGNVGDGLWALGVLGPSGVDVGEEGEIAIQSLTFTYRMRATESCKVTVSVTGAKSGATVYVTHRATGAGLAEQRSLLTWLEGQGVHSIPE